MVRNIAFVSIALGALTVACGGPSSSNLNQTSITCPPGRTLLDGVCVSEPVADYVACVRAQGAQLGAAKHQQLSAEAGTMGVKAAGAAEVSENLEKKYAASDSAMLEIVHRCANFGAQQISANAAGSDKPIDISGEWSLEFEGPTTVKCDAKFVQTGLDMMGTYCPDNGTYRGTVKGRELTGTWSHGGTGSFTMTFAPDGKSFEGLWSSGNGPLKWWHRGKRK